LFLLRFAVSFFCDEQYLFEVACPHIVEYISWCLVLLLSFILSVELCFVDYCTVRLNYEQVGVLVGWRLCRQAGVFFGRQDSSLLFQISNCANTSILVLPNTCFFGTSTLCHYRLFTNDYVSLQWRILKLGCSCGGVRV